MVSTTGLASVRNVKIDLDKNSPRIYEEDVVPFTEKCEQLVNVHGRDNAGLPDDDFVHADPGLSFERRLA